MPFVALLDGEHRVDATDPSFEWTSIWRVTPRRDLTSPECGWPLHAKRREQRFFAHDRRAPECSSVGESPEHRRLKRHVADTLRVLGWTVQVEHEIGPRRADVAAWPPASTSWPRPVAMEIQLSRQGDLETEAREADYDAHGFDTLWIVRRPSVLGERSVRHVRLEKDEVVGLLTEVKERPGNVRVGEAVRPVEVAEPQWRPSRRSVGLGKVLEGIGEGRLAWREAHGGWIATRHEQDYLEKRKVFDEAKEHLRQRMVTRMSSSLRPRRGHAPVAAARPDAPSEKVADQIERRLVNLGRGPVRRDRWFGCVELTAADGGVYLIAWHAGIAPPGPEVRAVVAISLRVVHDLERIGISAMIFDDVPDAALRALGRSVGRYPPGSSATIAGSASTGSL